MSTYIAFAKKGFGEHCRGPAADLLQPVGPQEVIPEKRHDDLRDPSLEGIQVQGPQLLSQYTILEEPKRCEQLFEGELFVCREALLQYNGFDQSNVAPDIFLAGELGCHCPCAAVVDGELDPWEQPGAGRIRSSRGAPPPHSVVDKNMIDLAVYYVKNYFRRGYSSSIKIWGNAGQKPL